ncbi:hypothetical protein JTE90_018980 [Oedothorax gibbosus]|uniref:Uncharacterized protein n=1 Tax=Oedothorax gibbosus TaxID=931172 RepID=A0AAV6TFN4_9ARAC|nr:hypothetical protein JTE90_018980 [Oedothorax gibbosus]
MRGCPVGHFWEAELALWDEPNARCRAFSPPGAATGADLGGSSKTQVRTLRLKRRRVPCEQQLNMGQSVLRDRRKNRSEARTSAENANNDRVCSLPTEREFGVKFPPNPGQRR